MNNHLFAEPKIAPHALAVWMRGIGCPSTLFRVASALLLMGTSAPVVAENMLGYRGINNSGAYAAKGLLRAWPEGGPKFLWKADPGPSWANVAVVDEQVYIPGGLTAYLYVYDLDGKLLNKAAAGSGVWVRWAGSRTTPIVHDGVAAIGMPNADYIGIDLATMESRWQINAWKTFGSGKGHQRWGWPESPMRHEHKLIFNACSRDAETPGFVAVDIRNGKTVWQVPGKADIKDKDGKVVNVKRYSASDVSGACFRHKGRDLVAFSTFNWFVCLDAQTGAIQWEVPFTGGGMPPIYDNGRLLADLKGSLRMLQLSEDGSSATVLWSRKGGFGFNGGTLFNDRVYVFGDKNAEPVNEGGKPVLSMTATHASTPQTGAAKVETALLCLDATTGKLISSLPSGNHPGNIVSAEGMVYATDVAGNGLLRVRLVHPTPGGMEVAGQLMVKDPTGGEQGFHWAISPVVAEGRLFIRYGELYVYDIRVEKRSCGWRQTGNGIVDGVHPPLPWSRVVNLRWSMDRGGSRETLTPANGRILVGGPGGLACVNTVNGKTLWEHTESGAQKSWTACPVVREDDTFSVFGNGVVARLNMANGRVKWTAHCKTSPTHRILSPLLSENVLAVQSAELTGFDAETGRQLWKHPVPAGGHGTPAKLRIDGVSYFVTGWGALVRAVDGAIANQEMPVATGDLLVDDETAYLCGPTVVSAIRFSAEKGAPSIVQRWDAKVRTTGLAPLAYNGLLFVPTPQPALVALDAATGKTVGELPLAKPLSAAPLLANGLLWLPGSTTRIVKPTAKMEAVWEFSGAVQTLAFDRDGVTVLIGTRLHRIGGSTVAEPDPLVTISVDAPAVSSFPPGLPSSPFMSDEMPSPWLWAAPIPGRNLTNDFLAALGGIAKAMPSPDTTFTVGGKAYGFQLLNTNHVWQHPRFTANRPAIDLTAVHNRQFHTTGLYVTTLENEKARWVRLELLTPGRSHFRSQLDFAVFLSGKKIEENTPIRLPAGRHPLFIQATIGQCETWGKIWMHPRLIDVTDETEKRMAQYQKNQENWRQYQANEAGKPFVLEERAENPGQ